ncbi:MAG: exopolysaccharide biosynthesis polyprenyl glycosylphosphotransferase [Sandaracinaceae bacterium]
MARSPRPDSALARLQLVVDGMAVAAAMAISAWTQPVLADRFAFVRASVDLPALRLLAGVTALLVLGLTVMLGLDRSVAERWPKAETVGRLLMLHVLALVGLGAVAFLTQTEVNRSLVGLFLSGTFALMTAQRLAAGLWTDSLYRRGIARSTILLVGHPSDRMKTFLEDVRRARHAPSVLGYLADEPGHAPEGVSYLGPTDALDRTLHEHPIEEVFFFAPDHHPEERLPALEACERLGVAAHFVVSLAQIARAQPRIAERFAHPTVTFTVAEKSAALLALKHALDPLAALLLLVLTAPVLALATLAIWVRDGRPVFFVQERAGRHGRPFRMLKLRTMRLDADADQDALRNDNEMSGPVFKIADDPRVTRLGAWLRKTSIDELPQLFNVLSGAMSLVGPRPLPVAEQAQIRGVPRRRLSMKPGITCLWQISGRSDVDFDDWMLLDLRYVDEWSPWLDLTILLRTLPVVLFRKGAR